MLPPTPVWRGRGGGGGRGVVTRPLPKLETSLGFGFAPHTSQLEKKAKNYNVNLDVRTMVSPMFCQTC